ncbi:MAG: J domain-containing protein [Acidimicrobiales bacterium]
MTGRDDAHYDVLGVDPSASVTEIRRAYLGLARDAHPDFHHTSETERRSAELRMRKINAAWAVLGDPDARSAYDRRRLAGAPRPTFHARSHGTVEEPDPWRPFDDGDPAGFDDRDDRPITGSSLPSWMKTVPALGVLFGLAALILGGLVGLDVMARVGMLVLLLSVMLFLSAPLVALSMSSRQDTDP